MAQPVILLILSLSQVVNIPYMDMHGKLALSVWSNGNLWSCVLAANNCRAQKPQQKFECFFGSTMLGKKWATVSLSDLSVAASVWRAK